MLTNQEFYNKVCDSLRTYGNPYGSGFARGWGWINPDDPNQRCAIARFIPGNTSIEVIVNLTNELYGQDMEEYDMCLNNPLVKNVIQIFDQPQDLMNTPAQLEHSLQNLADHHLLKYTAPEVKTSILETV